MRGVLLALCVGAAAGGFSTPSATAAAPPPAIIQLELNGVPGIQVALDGSGQYTPDLQPVSDYPNYTPAHPTAIVPVPAGFSAAFLASLAGAGSRHTSEIQIVGDTHVLLGKYLDPANSYPPGQFNPVFYTDGSGVAQFRQPPTSATDHGNAAYTFTAPTSTMTVNVITPRHLDVTATLDTSTAKPGGQINFTVTVPVSQALPGETLTAKWIFGDGTTSEPEGLLAGTVESATTTKRFMTAGTYTATVTVEGDMGSSGSATAPQITISTKAGQKGPGTHHPNKHKRPVGGSPHKKQTQSVPGNGSGTTGPPTSSSQPTSPQTTTPAPPQPVVKKTLPKVPSVAGVPVSGILLSGSVTEVARAASRSVAGAGGASTNGPGGGAQGAAGGIGLALLLLVGGMLSEGLSVARWR